MRVNCHFDAGDQSRQKNPKKSAADLLELILVNKENRRKKAGTGPGRPPGVGGQKRNEVEK
jgi:hypothetical protein